MKNKNQVIFILVTLVLVMFAVFAIKQENKTASNPQEGKKLFPKLEQQVNDVTRIVSQQGDNTVTIEQVNGQWQIAEKGGYPANVSSIKETILSIADLGLFEAKTKKAENYKKLQVEDAMASGTKSSMITLSDKTKTTLASVILGKTRPGSQPGSSSFQYVRISDEEQVWLVKGEASGSTDVAAWLDVDLMNISAKRIRRVTVTHPAGQPFSIVKASADDNSFTLAKMPKGKKLKSDTEADKLGKALQNLILTDVSKADSLPFENDKTTLTSFESFDGMIISAGVFTKDDTTWLKLSARFDPNLRATETAGKDSAPAKTTPALKDATAVQEEVKALNAKLSPWVFQTTDASISLMTTQQDSLIDDAAAK